METLPPKEDKRNSFKQSPLSRVQSIKSEHSKQRPETPAVGMLVSSLTVNEHRGKLAPFLTSMLRQMVPYARGSVPSLASRATICFRRHRIKAVER